MLKKFYALGLVLSFIASLPAYSKLHPESARATEPGSARGSDEIISKNEAESARGADELIGMTDPESARIRDPEQQAVIYIDTQTGRSCKLPSGFLNGAKLIELSGNVSAEEARLLGSARGRDELVSSDNCDSQTLANAEAMVQQTKSKQLAGLPMAVGLGVGLGYVLGCRAAGQEDFSSISYEDGHSYFYPYYSPIQKWSRSEGHIKTVGNFLALVCVVGKAANEVFNFAASFASGVFLIITGEEK